MKPNQYILNDYLLSFNFIDGFPVDGSSRISVLIVVSTGMCQMPK